MNAKSILQYRANGFLLKSQPEEGLARLIELCQSAERIIQRADLSERDRIAQLSMWHYVASIARYLKRRWSRPDASMEDEELVHIHFTMLPALIAEHASAGARILRGARNTEDLRQAWRDNWQVIIASNARLAV